ncbi:META domain-containing protein [Rheinheimera baltica]|uniref:META domain-containing protein n=1 Tax=Rheinheimera baltica TaxID=67576 RepID=A0ABT9HUP2_9GAMM|nr:META domain-containing protein [Rheinheimera baltica]MDP5134718.1 META domain-containing protein [Rheinheimera baltica]MDP5148763.1 META domain-containing protein [Rheinheimera baltica]
MKKRLIFTALLLSGCSQLPQERSADLQTLSAPAAEQITTEPQQDIVIENDATAEAMATDFEHIFVDTDMTFSGTLPCADCPGIAYHINLFRDGRFAARQEYIDRNQVNIVRGIWLLEKRSLHLVNQQQTLPAFHFLSNTQLAMLDMSGKPLLSNVNYQLTRETEFRKLDTRQAMLGIYTLSDNQASFTSCASGEMLAIANTQHHLPVMRQYQQDERLRGNDVIATMLGRRGQDDQANLLFIDKFEQFWPGAVCPDQIQPGKMQGIVWRAEKIANRYVPQQLNVRVIFEQNDRLYGFAGCNNFNGSYKQRSNQLNVQPLVSTRKFCADSSELESQFTQSLQSADRAEVNGDTLQIFKNNQLILQFKPAVN